MFQHERFAPVETVIERCSAKKVCLKNLHNSQESTCTRVFFLNEIASLRPAALLKKETLTEVFSCEFCENFKLTFFHRTPTVAASAFE